MTSYWKTRNKEFITTNKIYKILQEVKFLDLHLIILASVIADHYTRKL